MNPTRVAIPTLVRIKSGALDRLGIYLARFGHKNVIVLQSEGLPTNLCENVKASLQSSGVEVALWQTIAENQFEAAIALFKNLPRGATAIVGVGGGKALDLAKYVAFLAKLPYIAVPTSLSNDGFSSPQSSLTIEGKRRSLAATMPFGVVIDTAVCAKAPQVLSLSGVGDLVAKFTAIEDWKLAFHHVGEPVDDFAALLSDGSVRAFLARPMLDEEGLRMLATSLLFNGIAMEVCGSSRPASGSEHLISHALDELSARPRLHGLQVGVATYLISLLQQNQSETIADLFERTGFWEAIIADPFSKTEWHAAIAHAPEIKPGFFTVLNLHDTAEIANILTADSYLQRCIVAD